MLRLDNIAEINLSEQLYYTYFEVNYKQKIAQFYWLLIC
jgi:hypothetical protein